MFKCLTLYLQSGAMVETLGKAAEFLGSILHHTNLFSILCIRAATGIRLDGTVMHYKL